MPVFVNILTYLQELKRNQTAKPKDERLEVPTLAEIAERIGMTRESFSRVANNQTRYIDKEAWGVVLDFLRERGFSSADIADVFIYKPRDQIE
jgi:hypothetical protein